MVRLNSQRHKNQPLRHDRDVNDIPRDETVGTQLSPPHQHLWNCTTSHAQAIAEDDDERGLNRQRTSKTSIRKDFMNEHSASTPLKRQAVIQGCPATID